VPRHRSRFRGLRIAASAFSIWRGHRLLRRSPRRNDHPVGGVAEEVGLVVLMCRRCHSSIIPRRRQLPGGMAPRAAGTAMQNQASRPVPFSKPAPGRRRQAGEKGYWSNRGPPSPASALTLTNLGVPVSALGKFVAARANFGPQLTRHRFTGSARSHQSQRVAPGKFS
jgi:hypothetical protein